MFGRSKHCLSSAAETQSVCRRALHIRKRQLTISQEPSLINVACKHRARAWGEKENDHGCKNRRNILHNGAGLP
jgi:hypothetical protein